MKLRQMLLFQAVLLISLQISAQDLIYKRNGEIVKAKILYSSDKSLSYQLSNHLDSLTYFINVSAVDSIIYSNGIKTSFIKVNVDSPRLDINQNTYNTHHLFGLDLAGFLFYRNLTFSYEFLPGKAKLGFKTAFAKQVELPPYPIVEFNFNRIPYWSLRLGINYYFFPPRTFRLGTGLYYIFGKYSTSNYYYFDPTSIYSEPENRNMSGMILSVFGLYNLNKNLAVNLGFDIPLLLDPTSRFFNSGLRCEILLNF